MLDLWETYPFSREISFSLVADTKTAKWTDKGMHLTVDGEIILILITLILRSFMKNVLNKIWVVVPLSQKYTYYYVFNKNEPKKLSF